MAWLDDRAWCHPKLVNLSDSAFRAYINSVAYSSGMGLRGILSLPQQRLIGSEKRIVTELISSGLWNVIEGTASIVINDWDEHNGKRDERRKKDRERKRQLRKYERLSALPSTGTSTGTSAGPSTLPAHVEGSEGSEGSDKTFLPSIREAVFTCDPDPSCGYEDDLEAEGMKGIEKGNKELPNVSLILKEFPT